MKSFFKRSAISVIVLGMAGSVYAAAVPSTYNYNNWAPQLTGAFIGVEGLDLRPMNGDLDYVTVNPINSSVPGTFSNDAIHTSFDWGWRVYGGLKFTENDDLTLSWMQLRASDSDSVAPTGIAINNAGFSTPRWLFNGPWLSVNGHVTFDLDDAYAVWGHTIYFNNPWSVRFAAGLEYAKLESDLKVTADSGNFQPGLGIVGFRAESDTKGIGPRVEFDMTYHLPCGFALYGKANGALLVSKRDLSLNVINTEQTTIDFANSVFSDRHVVIPKFGMRLGASYTYVWGEVGAEGIPCRTTSLTLDAGWQVESYIHAIERPEDGYQTFDTSSPNLATNVISSSGFASTKTSNFSDHGLFIGIKLGTDWM